MDNEMKHTDRMSEAFSSAPDLPESLSKERMVEMLKEKNITPKKKMKILPRVAGLAAMLMVTFICMYVYEIIPVNLQEVNPIGQTVFPNPSYPVIENSVEVHTLKKAESNAQLKKHMESVLGKDNFFNLFGNKVSSDVAYDYVVNGAVVAPTQAVTQAATSGTTEELKSESASSNTTADKFDSAEYGETNTQVEGVDEADIIKNDGRYLYIVASGVYSDTRLKIVDTETMTLLYDEYVLAEDGKTSLGIYDIYVNGDTLVAVCNFTEGNNAPYLFYDSVVAFGYDPWQSKTVSVVYDISDRSSPKEVRRVKQDGRMLSTRMNGSVLYTVTAYTVYNQNLDENYMPKVNEEFVGCDCVYIYDENSTSYTVLTAYDTADKNGEVGKVSVLGSGAEVYCTTDTLYVGMYDRKYDEDKTNIFAFSLDGINVAYKASGAVKGYFLNQFSFDEYKDCLRVATTTYDYKTDKDISSLYILNKELQLIGKLEDIADDEQIKSVRFMGDTGYIVTFRNTDPLFTLDLSDPTAPKILGELKLPGYSAYLHPIGDGYMVGIGYDGDEENAKFDSVKVSVFDVTDPRNPVESDTFIIKDAETDVNDDPKAFISSESMGFIGIPVRHFDSNPDVEMVLSYKILRIENGKILSHEGFTHPELSQVKYGYRLFRGTYIGEKLYTVSLEAVAEHSLNSGELLRTVDILGDYDVNTDVVTQTAPVNYNSGVVATTRAPGSATTQSSSAVTEPAITEPYAVPETEIAVEAEIVEKSKFF